MKETPEWLWEARVLSSACMSRAYPELPTDLFIARTTGVGLMFGMSSPLEELFALQLMNRGWLPISGDEISVETDIFRMDFGEPPEFLLAAPHPGKPVMVWPQAAIFGDRRRADFAFIGGDTMRPLRLVVELDGFNFHERTAAQAANDRSRDRELKIDHGWDVLRFLSTELIHDFAKSALDQVECAIKAHLEAP